MPVRFLLQFFFHTPPPKLAHLSLHVGFDFPERAARLLVLFVHGPRVSALFVNRTRNRFTPLVWWYCQDAPDGTLLLFNTLRWWVADGVEPLGGRILNVPSGSGGRTSSQCGAELAGGTAGGRAVKNQLREDHFFDRARRFFSRKRRTFATLPQSLITHQRRL